MLYRFFFHVFFFTGNAVTQRPYRYSLVLLTPYFDPRYFNADFDNNGLFLLFLTFQPDIYLQFRERSILIWAINFIIKSIRKRIEILAKSLFSFSIIVFNMKFLVILFMRKSITSSKKLFGSLHTSNRIYLMRNCFSNSAYLKDMYLSLKGTEQIMFVSMLRILLIFKTLNFSATFTNKINVS